MVIKKPSTISEDFHTQCSNNICMNVSEITPKQLIRTDSIKISHQDDKKVGLKFICEKCDYTCNKRNDWDKHCLTRKHNIRTGNIVFEPEKQQDKSPFICETCHFSCSKLSKWKNHLETQKHKQECDEPKYICESCKTSYKSKSGLWYHKQRCEILSDDSSDEESIKTNVEQPPPPPTNNLITPELIMLLIQQNKEMQQAMIEMAKNMGNNMCNNNNNNTINNIQNNKSFNLNVFLNETCKDAMNMSDFLNMLDVTTYDFEQTGKNGYVQGMCRILENGLNKLEVHERPIHCTDAKRETIYIKDNDKWEKDDEQKSKLVGVIKQVGAKNIRGGETRIPKRMIGISNMFPIRCVVEPMRKYTKTTETLQDIYLESLW
jgi:hypothetical protein